MEKKCREFIDEVKEKMNFTKDIELCNAIGATKSAFDKWMQRDSIPPDKYKKIMDLVGDDEDSDNQITIPFYKDFAVSAGFGATNFDGEVELIPFNKNELRAMFGVVSFNKMGIVSVVGDSMYPTLKEGQMLLFQDDGSSIEGGIYIIEYQNEVFVKRLKKRPLSLVSDNKEYSNIEVKDLEELRIIGRVIGAYEIIYKRM